MIEIEYSRIFCYFDTIYNGKANKMSCLSTVSMEILQKSTQRKVSVIRVRCIQVEFVYFI